MQGIKMMELVKNHEVPARREIVLNHFSLKKKLSIKINTIPLAKADSIYGDFTIDGLKHHLNSRSFVGFAKKIPAYELTPALAGGNSKAKMQTRL